MNEVIRYIKDSVEHFQFAVSPEYDGWTTVKYRSVELDQLSDHLAGNQVVYLMEHLEDQFPGFLFDGGYGEKGNATISVLQI